MIKVTILLDETKIDKFGEVVFGLGGKIVNVNNWGLTGGGIAVEQTPYESRSVGISPVAVDIRREVL